MSEITKLYNEINDLRKELRELRMRVEQNNEFEDRFSGKTIINHEVQFMKLVRDKNGGIVTEINAT